MIKILNKVLFSFLFISSHTFADIEGVISRVVDADTVVVESKKGIKYKVRLLGIDAPEIKQAYGKESTSYLSNLVLGKSLAVVGSKKDRYHRLLGKLIFEGNDINLNLVKNGMAWHYKLYKSSQDKKDRFLYSNAEKYAKVNKLGLWSNSFPISPWSWRKKNK
tara:strand:- start:1048 stop:1536 length:489 start_codon:yes stop_codon:yes gene_type:complete